MRWFDQSPSDIAQAAELLRNGGVVSFPTETVYGLGAAADNAEAVARVFALKGRPPTHPLIVHIAAAEELERWAQSIPAAAWKLAERFWPGPLTLILRRQARVLACVTGGQETVGLRLPSHPTALALLTAAGCGLAAPSANRFGRISPTTAEHVAAEFGDALDGVVDGGRCLVGIESTIVDLSADSPRLLRPGAIGVEALRQTLDLPISCEGGSVPRVPGSLPSHYAPTTPLRLVSADRLQPQLAHSVRALGRGSQVTVMIRGTERERLDDSLRDRPGVRVIEMPSEPEAYARQLYAQLRQADRPDCVLIIVEDVPEGADWHAIRDRLKRASGSGS
jgi:L-threonylcarbamoyladenylate synthase